MGSCVSGGAFTFGRILLFTVIKQVGDEHECKILTTPPGFLALLEGQKEKKKKH